MGAGQTDKNVISILFVFFFKIISPSKLQFYAKNDKSEGGTPIKLVGIWKNLFDVYFHVCIKTNGLVKQSFLNYIIISVLMSFSSSFHIFPKRQLYLKWYPFWTWATFVSYIIIPLILLPAFISFQFSNKQLYFCCQLPQT